MDISSVFVTGANRGIGLEFVRQLVHLDKPPQYVFATYRSKDKIEALEEIAKTSKTSQVVLIQMDVTKKSDVKSARKVVEDTVGDKGLTLLINNAGALSRMAFPTLTPENLHLHFDTNTIGPVMVFQELLPSLKKAAKSHPGPDMSVSRAAVLNISSISGSITDIVNHDPQWLIAAAYLTSKAALNMVMRVAACTLKDDGVLVVNMCPGWVKTDMGSDLGEISVTESIATILDTLANLDESHHGLFLDRTGIPEPF